MKLYFFFFLFLSFQFLSCKTQYISSSHTENVYTIKDTTSSDTISSIEYFLKPYRDSLSIIMGEVIGIAEGDFHKQKGGGSLGNLITDAMYDEASKLMYIDGAVFNPGGIRLPDIMKGNITKGKMLELLPFDNELMILEIKGDILIKWLNHTAIAGGWPIYFRQKVNSNLKTDIQFKFKNNQLIQNETDTAYQEKADGSMQMIIFNSKINSDSTYFIATNDYVANGGDNCDFLKDQKRTSTGILIRNLVSDYIQSKKNIYPKNEERIQFEK